ncbi:uncharacterized protein LOC116287050 [Actinia tenebrosa]|uniref:Uncharacterized protein LOC116287050 n=1 Tax=Actinia tenebrosa TaxID=6105 RepID=A0A6P8GZ78_ACTTE|nr:uncharacterized protein LOC116287050 [Actinia tenebrosa]
MNGFMLNFCLIFFLIGLQMYDKFSDGFKWISLPSQRTKVDVGSIVLIRWYYECNEYGISNILYNNKEKFYRYGSKHNYTATKNVVPPFSVIGGSNVTIIIPDVDRDKNGSYCCFVHCDGVKNETCTTLVIYLMTYISRIH